MEGFRRLWQIMPNQQRCRLILTAFGLLSAAFHFLGDMEVIVFDT
jgi:hypothetical protein